MSDHPFYAIHERRPLMSVSAAALILEKSERHIYEMIECGKLPHAVNIARPGAKKKCVRVLTQNVFDLRTKTRIKPVEWAAIVGAILPQHRDTLRSAEIARMLHCDPDQANVLVRFCLGEARPRKQTSSESRIVKRSSLAKFLIERRIV